jgi:protoporphyrinogen IX oxidase
MSHLLYPMRFLLAFHIIFLICWFAGLFYLPRLFVYHAMSQDSISIERFKIMEKRLYYSIMTPSALLTIFFGVWLLSLNFTYYLSLGWMHAKLTFVALLIVYHIYCGALLHFFAKDRNAYTPRFYRLFNEIPALLLVGIVILAVVQPGF